ncbi:MAG: hypothetical protein IJF92_00415 [Bacilli bacterium]|nr:hypothetical protein [Bacilli bacterium]MBQ3307549.1 hypothetical protein [Bacilli bacterium]
MKEKYRFMLYLLRWQLSTPILALCLSMLNFSTLINTIIANLIGGIIFYWVDKYIFNKNNKEE